MTIDKLGCMSYGSGMNTTDTTYTDRYPSGLTYLACGAPHPSPESEYRRCSRPVNEDGTHRGNQERGHLNDLGNEWPVDAR